MLFCGGVDGEELFQEWAKVFEVEGVGSVGFGFLWIVVDFEEDAVDAGGDGGAGEQGDEFWLSAGDSVGGGGGLDGVGSVEDDGGEGAHDGERAHVDDEVVVAEGGSALGEEDAGVPGLGDFLDGVAHVPGSDELSFFDVDGAAGLCGGDEQVSLAAEEGGDLEDVDAFRGDGAVGGFVDVGENWEACGFGKAAEDRDAFDESGAAEAGERGAVGLVVGGLEDVGDAKVGGDALDGVGHGADVRLALYDAGSGDEEKAAGADVDGADFEFVAHMDIQPQRRVGSDRW